jgi:fluoroquinolone transport system permease protein
MNLLQPFKTFGPVDSKYIRRDDLTIMLVAAPFLLGMASRWLFPLIFDAIGSLIGLPIQDYLSPIMGYALILLMPLFSGMIIGLILLDQMDDQSIQGLQVSPVPMKAYISYRLMTPMLFSFIMTLIVYPLSGLQPIGFLSLVGSALLGMPFAPIIALAFATFAENKIQGLVLMKGSGGVLFLPIISYFIPPLWKYVFAFIPTYWPAQFYWWSLEQNPWRWLIWCLGMLVEILLIRTLLQRWQKKIYA